MNKLLLMLLATTSAAVLISQRATLSQARLTANHLAEQAESATRAVQAVGTANATLKSTLQDELARSQDLQQRLADWDKSPEGALAIPDTLQPGQRWPTDQPWCYLPKRDLLRYGFSTVTPGGRISDEAALLFGLSRTQRDQVDDAYQEFTEGLLAIDRANLQPIPAIPDPDLHDHKVRSYELNLPTEQIVAQREQFRAAVRSALSETQGDLFLQACDQQLSPVFYELSHSFVRLTIAEPPESRHEGDAGRILVEFNLNPGNKGHESHYLYPLDTDTALPFRHYATLLRNYEPTQSH